VSVLTKIFVVLLVVLSLLLSAATVTYVNTVDATRKSLDAAEARISNLTAEKSELAQTTSASLANYENKIAEASRREAALREQLTGIERMLASRDAELAQARLDVTLARADLSKLSSAVSAAVSMSDQLQQIVASLRSDNDRLRSENGDLNVALTDRINTLDVTETQRRILAEQLTEARRRIDQLSGALSDRGVDPARLAETGLSAGAPAIAGVIRSTQVIADISYATISLGVEDGVKNGMEFKIVDANTSRFLGILTVVQTDSNESIGRLTGPDVKSVAAGAMVRTQL
jgi:predicted  nucleic acid-binding Zn-ribbon protein